MSILLQIPVPATDTSDSISILDLTIKGGWVMIPIGILSVMAVYIIVERMLTLKKADKDPERIFAFRNFC